MSGKLRYALPQQAAIRPCLIDQALWPYERTLVCLLAKMGHLKPEDDIVCFFEQIDRLALHHDVRIDEVSAWPTFSAAPMKWKRWCA